MAQVEITCTTTRFLKSQRPGDGQKWRGACGEIRNTPYFHFNVDRWFSLSWEVEFRKDFNELGDRFPPLESGTPNFALGK